MEMMTRAYLMMCGNPNPRQGDINQFESEVLSELNRIREGGDMAWHPSASPGAGEG